MWKVPVSLDFDGLNSSATYSVTLTHLTTDHIDLELKYAQTAPLGPVPVAGLPDGVTAELLAFHIDGAGTQQTDLAQILPASSSLKASGDILFRLLQGADRRAAGPEDRHRGHRRRRLRPLGRRRPERVLATMSPWLTSINSPKRRTTG